MQEFYRIPDPMHKLYQSWKSDTLNGRKDWIERSINSEEYYYNDVDQTKTTFTGFQKTHIEQEGTNIPVSINFIHPVTNQKLALLAQVKPSMKVISTDGRAKPHAFVLDKMVHAVLNDSNSQLAIEQQIKDSLITGMGCTMVVPTNFYKAGQFRTQVVHVPWDEVILDINAKREDLADMEGFFVEKEFTVPKMMQLYKHIFDNLVDPATGNTPDPQTFIDEPWTESELTEKAKVSTTEYSTDYKFRVREFYEKVYTKMYAVVNPDTELMEYLFAENLDEGQLALLSNAAQEIPGIYIKRTLIFGSYVVDVKMLPITEYPVQVSFFEWGGKPYRSYGMIHFTRDMQAAFDKIMQIMILNGILSNNAGWSAPKGSIAEEDRRKWEEFGNNPRVIKEYVPKLYGNEVLVPRKDEVSQLSNFYPLVLEMLKSGIEYSTGVNAILQGNAKEAGVDVFSSLQQYQNAAMQRIMLSSAHINQMLTRLGKVLTEYLTSNITAGDFYFFDEKGTLAELSVAKEIINEMKLYNFLTTVVPAQAFPTQRLATATELMKIAQSSSDQVERSVLTQKALELSDIREYDDMREEISLVSRTQSELSDLQEGYDRLVETSKQMENKYVNISLENRILKELISKEKKIAAQYGKAEQEIKDLVGSKKAASTSE